MDTKKLRQKILDLAIRGKLVPQDPNDEPASVLLERIKAEKEQLIKEGKIKRSKKSESADKPHYENVPFEIPESWVWVDGGQVFLPMNSCRPQGDVFKYIDIDSIDNKNHRIIEPKLLKVNSAPSRASRFTKVGDVIFSMVRPYLKNIAIVNENDCIASTGFFVCSPSQLITSEYCYYMMLSDYVVYGLNQFMKGDNSPSINNNHITSWIYPIPPINEQYRICDEIKKLWKYIDDIEDGNIKLESYIKQTKSKILDLAISGKLVPQDHADEPAIELLKRINPYFKPCDNSHYEKLPNGWCVCLLKDVFEIIMGQSPDGDSINCENGVEFHQGKICFTNEYLLPSGVYTSKPTKIAEANSLLLCVRAPVGILNITKRKICIGRGLCSLKPKYEIDNKYWFYILSAYKDYFEQNATGSTFKAISGDTIKNTEILLPPINEQIRITKAISSLWNILDAITTELQ